MAAIYWRGDIENRTGCWWVKTYHPTDKETVRHSLETVEEPRAELIRQRLELELEVQSLTRRGIFLPPKLIAAMDLDPAASVPAIALAAPTIGFFPTTPSPPIEEVLGEFLAFIKVENSPAHAGNKIGYLKKFFGSELLGLGNGVKGVFRGKTLADVKVAEVRKLIDSLPLARKTEEHHREAFHAF